jgi:hypothetical protein
MKCPRWEGAGRLVKTIPEVDVDERLRRLLLVEVDLELSELVF